MKTIDEILKSFDNPFTEYLKDKPVYTKGRKTGDVSFIPWYNLCEILDQLAPGWEWEIKSCDYHGDRIVLVGRLTIHGSDGSLSREATGNEDSNCSDFGDPSSNAEAMAMRRCAAKFGIGRYLWCKDSKQSKPDGKWDECIQEAKQNFNKPQPKGTISKEEFERRKQQSMGYSPSEIRQLNREALGNIPD